MFKLVSAQVPIIDKYQREFTNERGEKVPYYRLSTVDEKGYRFDLPCSFEVFQLLNSGESRALVCDYAVYGGKAKLRVIGLA